ncbi:hypothetical protein [Nocardioides panzhihuensis]|uniref:DUF559 domain-containing protein n=1 Tax=Nocardioides panzhihuensis TaxID=860243 RepID=A0A7Z0DPV3_9ACTN|nr:hypothetical protein [Nocardioides panzhihuensis]NYI79600.1 hypothetical protein [Nocardioides panzhihuensis]
MGESEEQRLAREKAEDAARMLRAQLLMQAGVASHAQLAAGGVTKVDMERRLRRKELRRVHPRVYVDHAGPMTWPQRAWAAVLYAGPAYLCWTSIEEPRGRDDGAPIHVAIDHSRRIRPQDGIVIHRMKNMEQRAYGGVPPRLAVEDNALAMAHEAKREIDAIARLAEVASRRYVTAATLRAALDRYPSVRRRSLIAGLIDDLEAGTHSVLEHGYLAKVERAHGLPIGARQAPRPGPDGSQFRDVEYQAYKLVVELDGALGHESWRDQARDADRALDDLASAGMLTARLRFHQVFETPCQTATRIARILRRNGWDGTMRACGETCRMKEA